MTLTVNPLMGHISATYATKASDKVALATRFDFNTYSYESDVVLGCELWRSSSPPSDPSEKTTSDFVGVLKANWRQSTRMVGLLWEGRIKSLIFSIGSSVDFARGGERPFRALGIEVAYSSYLQHDVEMSAGSTSPRTNKSQCETHPHPQNSSRSISQTRGAFISSPQRITYFWL